MTDLVVSDLTQSTLEGTGVFDVLMRSTKTHLESEFAKNRIKGAEYATVYLGSLDSVMRTSMEFLLQKQRIGLEAQLLQQQILLAQVGVQKANAELAIVTASLAKIPLELAQLTAQTELVNAQKANTLAELAIIQANALKVPAEIAQIQAQTTVTAQQKLNLVSENLGTLAKTSQIGQQTTNLFAEALNIPKQGLVIDAQKAQLDKQVLLATQQTANLVSENLSTVAKTSLITEQVESEAFRNFIHPTNDTLSGTLEKEREVLIATECKLRAEFDVLMSQKLKGASENTLLLQKVATEKAQVVQLGVDDNSVIGRQKALYLAQSEGFKRDAEQKAAKIMVDTWNVRMTTKPDSTVGDTFNNLTDPDIGKVITKLQSGIGVIT